MSTTTVQKWLLFFCAAAFGGLLNFAFAPYRIFPLAFILPALIFHLINRYQASPFRLGYGFGLGFFGFGVHWVVYSLYDFGNMPLAAAIAISALFILALSLFPAFAYHVSFKKNQRNPMRYIFLFPAVWVLLEWLREWLLTGFPWHFIGYSQTSSPLAGYAPLMGVYGVSLVTLMCAGSLYQAYVAFQLKLKRMMIGNLLFTCTLLLSGWIASFIHWTTPQSTPINISIVQGNIPQTLKWSEEHIAYSLDEYERLSEPLWKESQVVIWPETAVPLFVHQAKEFIQSMHNEAQKYNTEWVTGIPIQKNDFLYNAAINTGNGQHPFVYLKRFLVPFGEYTPFESYTKKILSSLDIPLSDLYPGTSNQPPFLIRKIPAAMAICYEIAYPHLMRITNPEVGLIVTLSNDAWFGQSNAQAQHFQIAEMRSLENERPGVFVNNTGISGMINEKGKVLASIPPNQSGTATHEIQARSGKTPWQTYSMDIVLILIASFVLSVYRYEKKSESLSSK